RAVSLAASRGDDLQLLVRRGFRRLLPGVLTRLHREHLRAAGVVGAGHLLRGVLVRSALHAGQALRDRPGRRDALLTTAGGSHAEAGNGNGKTPRDTTHIARLP